MNEFDLIQRYFNSQNTAKNEAAVGIGDDCAILEIPQGFQLAISMDTLVAGVHFPETMLARDIGYKALAVNLSDCAAVGAKPLWATLAITLPKVEQSWLEEFSQGFFVMAKQHGVTLVGGDTTRGPLSITVQIHGIVTKAKALLRSAANIGDDIYVTGSLGDAGLALQTLLGHVPKLEREQQAYIESRLNRPNPRVEIGQALVGIAHACIDISDGLAADLNHILVASNCGAEIDPLVLPISPALRALDSKKAQYLALYSGDDYELCFTAPKTMRKLIAELSQKLLCPITHIGRILETPGLFQAQTRQAIAIKGYQHF